MKSYLFAFIVYKQIKFYLKAYFVLWLVNVEMEKSNCLVS